MTFAVWLCDVKCQPRNFSVFMLCCIVMRLGWYQLPSQCFALLTVFPWVRPANKICLFPPWASTPLKLGARARAHTRTHNTRAQPSPTARRRGMWTNHRQGEVHRARAVLCLITAGKTSPPSHFSCFLTLARAREPLSCADTRISSIVFRRAHFRRRWRHADNNWIHAFAYQATSTRVRVRYFTRNTHTNIRFHILVLWRQLAHTHPHFWT